MSTYGGGTPRGESLTDAISAATVSLDAQFYGRDRTTAATYVNDNVVVCVLKDILSVGEDKQISEGHSAKVIDGRVAFQDGTEDEASPVTVP